MLDTEPHTNGHSQEGNSEQAGSNPDTNSEQGCETTGRADNAPRPAEPVQNVQERTRNKPKKQRKPQENIKREKLLAALPLNDWNVRKAAIAVGYTKYYATHRLPYIIKNDVKLCAAIEAKKRDIELRGDIEGTELVDRAVKLLDDPTTPKGVQARLLETLMKYKGMLTERRIIENVDRQTELTEAEQAEGKRLAAIRFRPAG